MRYAPLPAAAAVLMAGATSAADQNLLTPACETALALSALPQALRDDASVYVRTAAGFELERQGDGPFTCIVERNHADALIPQCPDAAGADTVIPAIIQRSEWALEGIEAAERRERFLAAVERGDFEAPARPGISYMMSEFNYVWNATNAELMVIPPHVMFYAPNLSDEDIGGSQELGLGSNRGYPFITGEGIHGYMISMVERGSDSSDVAAACAGQLPDVSRS